VAMGNRGGQIRVRVIGRAARESSNHLGRRHDEPLLRNGPHEGLTLMPGTGSRIGTSKLRGTTDTPLRG
jgi:hypothetical protein